MKYVWSPTYKEVSVEKMAQIIKEFIKDDQYKYTIHVGTDSQTSLKMKIISAIAVHKHGHGAIFFIKSKHLVRPKTLADKITIEAKLSLELVKAISPAFDNYGIDSSNIIIEVDIGNNGETKQFIKWIIGWIEGEGYECRIKPNSPIASCVADKYSKI